MKRILFLVLALAAPLAAPAVEVQYSRDARYIYEKTAVPLSLSMSPEQADAIKAASGRIVDQLTALQGMNPRTGIRGKIDKAVIADANAFEAGLNDMIDYTQKYYGSVVSAGSTFTKAMPTGVVLFSGFEFTGGWAVSGGGSVMLGIVLVPMHVKRIDIDTQEATEYTDFDTNLIVWPTANVGVGAGGGANFRGGAGVIWGELNNAKEFAGLVVGVSGTANLGIGTNAKAQFLKNWKKQGAVSNFFITAGAEIGPAAKLEGHGNLSYLVDADTYLKAGQTGVEKLLNKIFAASPQASRTVSLASFPEM
jgi:hypothetical protein